MVMDKILNSAERYGLVAKFLHWLMFVIIVYMLIDNEIIHDLAPGDEKRRFFIMLHQSLGIIVFALVCLRLIWKFLNKKPDYNPKTPLWMRRLAYSTHWILYIAILIQPITGMLSRLLDGRSVPFFDLFRISPVVILDNITVDILRFIHYEVIPTALKFFILVHIFGALYHHFIMKDNTLKRMSWGK